MEENDARRTPVNNTFITTGANDGTTNIVTPGTAQSTGRETPPSIREAIETIESYEYDPRKEEEERENEHIALMMFGSPKPGHTDLPTLRTGAWPYAGKKPNPIVIGTAVKLLAAAYAEVPCELEAAGVHGYAWMIEPQEKWERRKDIDAGNPIAPPTKPLKVKNYDIKAQWEYADKMQEYTMYNHLVQEGKAKLIEWFGKELFVDLFVDGLLPNTATPKELIGHLTTTYAKFSNNRRYMEEVDAAFNKPYDPKNPVEAYFMQLQDARAHAEMLEEPYTDERVMNKALREFEKHYKTYKAENKWYEKPKAERNWNGFKEYWKNQIHQWDTMAGSTTRQAHIATEVQGLKASIEGLKAETRTLHEDNSVLTQQLQFHQAMQAQAQSHSGGGTDDISVLTTMIEDLTRRVNTQEMSRGTDTSSTRDRALDLLATANRRDPRCYMTLNNGKGKQFTSYCWNCGANCTHWTRRCYELTEAQRKKYRAADFTDQMGGSTKFLARKDKYQVDYNFDSL